MRKTITGQIGGSNLRDKIKQTEHFKSFPKFRKSIFLKSNNIRQIQLALNIIDAIGFEKWNQQSGYNYNNKAVVKELNSINNINKPKTK